MQHNSNRNIEQPQQPNSEQPQQPNSEQPQRPSSMHSNADPSDGMQIDVQSDTQRRKRDRVEDEQVLPPSEKKHKVKALLQLISDII